MDGNRRETGSGVCGVTYVKTTLTDNRGKTLGYIQEVSPYRHELRDASGKTLGFYNPHLDQTFTASGCMLGHGNLMSSLIAQHR